MPRRPYSEEITRWRKAFGCQLRRIRDPFFTQDELSFKLSVDRTTIAKWESGHHTPGLADLQSLLTIFHKAELLRDARQAYRLTWFLRHEAWYSEPGIRAMLLKVFGEPGEGWESVHKLYWQVPRLSPAHYILRPDLLDPLQEELLNAAGPMVIGLWGMGGIGKTTLLRALGQEPQIWGHFDFILWAEIGPQLSESRTEEQLRQWAQLLDMPATERPTIDALTRALREWLAADRFLLLLDDAWDSDALRSLLITGPKGCAVVATRNRAVLEGLEAGAKLVAVSSMTLDQARQLVENVTGQGISPQEQLDFGAIHRSLEGLPLAITLVAPWIGEKGCEWTLRSLEKQALRLPLLEREGQPSRHGSVRAAFALSYEQMEAQGRPDLQARFRPLGVLAAAPFSAETAAAIWECADIQTAEEALARLCRLSLVQREETAPGASGFHLHRLLHDFARELLEEQRGEMDQSIERYIRHQTVVAEALNLRFGSGDEQLGDVLREFGQELPHLDQAFRYALERGNADALGRLLYFSSSLLHAQGNHAQVEQWLDQADGLLDSGRLGSDQARKLSAQCHFHRGRLLLDRADYPACIEQMIAALGRGLSSPAAEATALASLAVAFQAKGDLTAADSALFQAEMKETAVPDSWLKCQLISLRADLARAQGQPVETVLDLHGQAIECFEVYGNRVDEIKERAKLTELFLETDEWKRALAEARTAFEMAVQLGLIEMGYDIAVAMALEASDRGEQDTVREWLSGLEGVVVQLIRRHGVVEPEQPYDAETGEQRERDSLQASLEAVSQLWSTLGDRRRLERAQEMVAYLARL